MLPAGSAFILVLPIAHWVTRTGSTAKCLISKMEVCSFEHSLWHSSVIASHELDHSRWCQPCLLTARRTSADLIRHTCSSHWAISTSSGVVFLVKHEGELKPGGWVVRSYRAVAVIAQDLNQPRSKNVINGQWRRWQGLKLMSRTNLRTSYWIKHDYVTAFCPTSDQTCFQHN